MLPLFDCRDDARGIFAVGSSATGVFALGQFATGVFALGQFARGFIAVGQFALGVVTIGQFSGGIVGAIGMFAVSARAKGLLALSVLPRTEPASEVTVVPVATLFEGAARNAWVRLQAIPNGLGDTVWYEDGVPVRGEVHTPRSLLVLRGLRSPTDFLVQVAGEDVFTGEPTAGLRSLAARRRRLVVQDVRSPDGRPQTSVFGWIFRAIAGIVLTGAVAQFALRPAIELLVH